MNYWPFFQLPSFQYLTGFEETDAALVLVKRKDSLSATMFVPSRNPVQERWIGARTKAADMKAKTGIDGRDIAELTPAIDSLAKSGLPFYVISDVQAAENATADSLTRGSRFAVPTPALLSLAGDALIGYCRHPAEGEEDCRRDRAAQEGRPDQRESDIRRR